jgi:hypothetical protein
MELESRRCWEVQGGAMSRLDELKDWQIAEWLSRAAPHVSRPEIEELLRRTKEARQAARELFQDAPYIYAESPNLWELMDQYRAKWIARHAWLADPAEEGEPSLEER